MKCTVNCCTKVKKESNGFNTVLIVIIKHVIWTRSLTLLPSND